MMSDEKVEVPFGESPGETATLLLAAAEDLDLDAAVVATTSDASFVVPKEVASKAGLKGRSDDVVDGKVDNLAAREATDNIAAAKNEEGAGEDFVENLGYDKSESFIAAKEEADHKAAEEHAAEVQAEQEAQVKAAKKAAESKPAKKTAARKAPAKKATAKKTAAKKTAGK